MKIKVKNLAIKYSHLSILLYGLVVWMWFFILEHLNLPTKVWLYLPLDGQIPFTKEFVVPYVLWYVYMVLPYIYYGFYNPAEFKRLAKFMFTGMLMACIIFTVVPNGQQLRPEVLGDDFLSRIMTYLYSLDTPTNSAPSIHVINSIAVHCSIWHSKVFGKLVKLSSLVLCILISLSTVFVKQHSVLCIFAALFVCGIIYVILYRDELAPAAKSFR